MTSIQVIGIIVDLLTDEQKEILSHFNDGVCVLTVEEQLKCLYSNKYPRYDECKTKVFAAQIIRQNSLNFEKAKIKNKLVSELTSLEAYGETKKVKDSNKVTKDAVSRSSANTSHISFIQDKTRHGLSNYSVEFDKEKDWNEEDNQVMQQVLKSNRNTQLDIVETGEKKETVLDPNAAVISTSVKEVVGAEENKPYLNTITLGVNRNLTVSKNDGINTSSADSNTIGQRESYIGTFNASEAATAMQDFKLEDTITKILNSFSLLFRDVRRCQ